MINHARQRIALTKLSTALGITYLRSALQWRLFETLIGSLATHHLHLTRKLVLLALRSTAQ
jgi:hypothetical protein